MKVFFSPDYVAAAESFDTTRKPGWIADSLAANPMDGVEIVAPMPLTFDEIAAVHDPAYVKAVQTGEPRELAASQGFTWDPGIWTMVTASNGGAVAAVRAARADGVAGSLSSGLHHAQRGRGAALCTFNGLVIAAKTALAEGAQSVMILDLDAHCGGGTHWILDSDPRIRQVDVSVNGVDGYMPGGTSTLDIVRTAGDYLPMIELRLGQSEKISKPDVCIYNAGMDPDERCGIGGLPGIDAAILRERERIVFQWGRRCGVPIAFVLAGGYNGASLTQAGLVELHRLTIEGALSPA
ncbi:MAG: hypothetical protein ABIS27_14885 [Longimicrobiales bacterium]